MTNEEQKGLIEKLRDAQQLIDSASAQIAKLHRPGQLTESLWTITNHLEHHIDTVCLLETSDARQPATELVK